MPTMAPGTAGMSRAVDSPSLSCSIVAPSARAIPRGFRESTDVALVMTKAFTMSKRTRTTVMTANTASVLAVFGLYGIENCLGETLGARPSWARCGCDGADLGIARDCELRAAVECVEPAHRAQYEFCGHPGV